MNLEKSKLIIAGVIALVAMGLAFRAMWSGNTKPKTVVAAPDISNEVAAVFERVKFDTHPTEDTVEQMSQSAANIVQSKAAQMQLLGAEDLALAVNERLLATLDPQLQRDLRAQWARGSSRAVTDDPFDIDNPDPKLVNNWAKARKHSKLAPFSLAGIDVVWVYRNGQKMPDAERLSADMIGTSPVAITLGGTARMDIPEDPKAHKLSIIEIRMPMQVRTMKGKPSIVFVGYQFGWNAKRSQWIPFSNVSYRRSGENSMPILF